MSPHALHGCVPADVGDVVSTIAVQAAGHRLQVKLRVQHHRLRGQGARGGGRLGCKATGGQLRAPGFRVEDQSAAYKVLRQGSGCQGSGCQGSGCQGSGCQGSGCQGSGCQGSHTHTSLKIPHMHSVLLKIPHMHSVLLKIPHMHSVLLKIPHMHSVLLKIPHMHSVLLKRSVPGHLAACD